MTKDHPDFTYALFECYGKEHKLQFTSERAADLYMEEEFGRDFIYDVESELEPA